MSLPTNEFDRLFRKIEETNRNVSTARREISIGFILLGIAILALRLGI